MAKTVVGLFESVSQADKVVRDLVDSGFRREDISVMAHHEGEAATRVETEGTSGAAIGAGTGAVIGGSVGLLAGLGMLAIPGIGPVLAAGPLVAALAGAGAGAVAGGLIGALVDLGVPEEEAEYYAEGVRRGGTLVVVRAEESTVDDAVAVMTRHGAVDIDRRGAEWRQSGWTGATPTPPSSTMGEPPPMHEPVTQSARGGRDFAAEQAGTSRKGEDMETIERSHDIDAPVHIVYQQWTRFEEFPRFMEGVEEVRRVDGKRLHWVASIGGARREWDAEITDEIPNQRVAWRSERGEFNAGSVTFQPLSTDRTRVMVRLAYEPKGLMERAGDALGLVSRRVEGDLERFKQFVEERGRESGAWRGTERGFEGYEHDFRQHYQRTYASRGQPYEYWAPGYRYGYELASDPRYRDRDWASIEADARRDWQQRHTGTWEEFKDTIRYAWDRGRGQRGMEEGAVKIPVVEEQLQVGKREVQRGGARVYSQVTETPVEQQIPLREERVRVERRPVDRPASEADLAAAKEGAIEVTETKEEPIVSKQARVVEEVVIDKDVTQRTERVSGTERRTEVGVEEPGPRQARNVHGFETYEPEFRQHYQTASTSRGHPYEHWAPAYRYGYELAQNPRYHGRDWSELEADARRDWTKQQTGTWEEFKDTVRYAWDKVRGRR